MKINRQPLLLISLLLLAPLARAELSVFACEPEWAALAQEIGGNRLHVYAATTAAQDPHYVQARPSLIAMARKADLLLCTGAELETGWLPQVLRKSRNSKINPGQAGHLMAADHLTLLEKPVTLDRSMGDLHAAGNPHVHLDPRNILRVAEVLTMRMSTLDPESADFYGQRFEEFRSSWLAAMEDWQQQGERLKGERIVVHHTEWTYLLHWLGIERAATLESKPGIPPGAAHLAELKKLMLQNPASAIIRSPINDKRPAEWLSKETGIPVVTLPYTTGGTADTESLQGLFDEIIKQLLQTAHSSGNG